MLDALDEVRQAYSQAKSFLDDAIVQAEETGTIHASQSQADLLNRLVDYYGDDALNLEHMQRASSDFGKIVSRIGEKGVSGISVRYVDSPVGMSDAVPEGASAQAHPRGNLLTLRSPFRSRIWGDGSTGAYSKDGYMQRVLGHEIVHPSLKIGPGTGDFKDGDIYGNARALELARAWNQQRANPPWRNVDNTTCQVLLCY